MFPCAVSSVKVRLEAVYHTHKSMVLRFESVKCDNNINNGRSSEHYSAPGLVSSIRAPWRGFHFKGNMWRTRPLPQS